MLVSEFNLLWIYCTWTSMNEARHGTRCGWCSLFLEIKFIRLTFSSIHLCEINMLFSNGPLCALAAASVYSERNQYLRVANVRKKIHRMVAINWRNSAWASSLMNPFLLQFSRQAVIAIILDSISWWCQNKRTEQNPSNFQWRQRALNFPSACIP